MKPLVAVVRSLLGAGLSPLQDRFEVRVGGLQTSHQELPSVVRGATAIVADPTVRVDAALLESAGPQLRLVANFAVGYDNVDLEACRQHSVLVTNTPDVLTNATAELALALTLSAGRLFPLAEADLRNGRWTGWDPGSYRGLELSGSTVGVVGMGRIGTRYAELVSGFGVELLYASRSPNPEVESRLGADRVELDELLGRADVVSLHAPATPETHHMIDADTLALMKVCAALVNTSRGTLVDSIALASALAGGRIAAAGLDVYEGEPDVPEALLAAPNAVLLPHIGSATRKARDGMALTVARNVIAVLSGDQPPNRVA